MLLICIPRVEQNTPDSVFSTVEAVRVSLKAENGEEEELAGGLACPRISGTGRWAGGLAPCGAPAACPGPAGLGGRAGGAPCRRPPRPARGEAAVGQAAGAVPPPGKTDPSWGCRQGPAALLRGWRGSACEPGLPQTRDAGSLLENRRKLSLPPNFQSPVRMRVCWLGLVRCRLLTQPKA